VKLIDNNKMTSSLLHIIPDIVNMLNDLIASLNRTRAETPQLRLLLGPVIWVVTLVRLFINTFYTRIVYLYEVEIWYRYGYARQMVLGCAPNSYYCFNKTKFLLVTYEFIYIAYSVIQCLTYDITVYLYFILKFVSVVVPFMVLTPMDRVPY